MYAHRALFTPQQKLTMDPGYSRKNPNDFNPFQLQDTHRKLTNNYCRVSNQNINSTTIMSLNYLSHCTPTCRITYLNTVTVAAI